MMDVLVLLVFLVIVLNVIKVKGVSLLVLIK